MCEYLVSAPWFLGLVVVSGVIGAIGAFIFYLFIRYVTGAGNDEKIWSREFLYSGFVTGIVERFFFTLLIGLFHKEGVDVGAAAIGWIAIKGQVHYGMFSRRGPAELPRAYLGLLGSMGSLIFAFAGGYVWTHADAAAKLAARILPTLA